MIGLTYNSKKYESSPQVLIANRLHRFFPPYICYMFVMLILHNKLYTMGIQPDWISPYDKHDMVNAFWGFFRLYAEPLNGALWFMVPYFWATVLYGITVKISKDIWKNRTFKERQLFIMLFCIFFAIIAFILIDSGLTYYDHAEIGLVCMPLVALGGYYQVNHDKIREDYINGRILIAFVCVLGIFLYQDKWIILDQYRFVGPWQFFIITAMSIYIWLFVIKKSENFRLFKKCGERVIILAGDYSMDIMTLHIVVFKLIDYVMNSYIMPNSKVLLSSYPVTYLSPWIRLIYVTLGILIPIMIRITGGCMWRIVMEGMRRIMQMECWGKCR